MTAPKSLAQMLGEATPKSSYYSVISTKHLFKDGTQDQTLIIPQEDLVDRASFQKLRAIAVRLAEACEQCHSNSKAIAEEHRFGEIDIQGTITGRALTEATKLLKGEE